MRPSGAKGFIVFALLVTGGVTVARDLRAGEVPRVRVLIAGMLVGIILTAIADAAPRIAATFAAIVLVTTALDATAAFWAGLNRALTGS